MPCSKTAYPSRADAKRSADRASNRKLRPYPCPICNNYHLTSMSKREMRQVRKRVREFAGMSHKQVVHERKKAQAKQRKRDRELFELVTGS